MGKIPYLKQEKNETYLMVDDKPFTILGGELHNSDGSDLSFMDQVVWPKLRKIGGNCYLTAVYWECMEPEEGKFDFSLVDGIIGQARREGVRLVLLWYGLWKNGRSQYVPAWMKLDDSCFYMRTIEGQPVESVSPFCEKAVEADAKAFGCLMAHLREIDEERTVIMIQVENEIGFWRSPRDYSEEAERLFSEPLPKEISELFGKEGTWEEAFGLKACEYFMAWGFSRAIQRIASTGKNAYPLPLFMNVVMFNKLDAVAGEVPSGEPLPRVHNIWRKFAPAIDLYGPDLYSPDAYKEISKMFADVNPLVIPEVGVDNCASKALFSIAAYNLICFSPMGIEALAEVIPEGDLMMQRNMPMPVSKEEEGALLVRVYQLLAHLLEPIYLARREGRIVAFYQQYQRNDVFYLDDYEIQVSYYDNGDICAPPERRERPTGAGFIIRTKKNAFIICAISCRIDFKPRYAEKGRMFILSKKELVLKEGGLEPGRILNGDERNFTAFGSQHGVQEIEFYYRK